MVKHIVLFKLGPFSNEEERVSSLTEIKNALEALKGEIAELKEIEVGINANPAEQFDLSLTTLFDSMEALDIYAKHPSHVAVAKNMIAPLKLERSCVDYIV